MQPESFLLGLVLDHPVAVAVLVVSYALSGTVVTLVHELGHAAVALRLTDDDVLVQLDGRRHWYFCRGRLHIELALHLVGGGVCSFDPPPGRYGLAKIAVGGPLASLAAGLVSVAAWGITGWLPVGAFAARHLVTAACSARPRRVRQDGRWRVSDGLVVARSLGLIRPPRPRATDPILGRPYAIVLGLVGVLVIAVKPSFMLILAPAFGYGWLQSYADRRRAAAAEERTPPPPETWDSARSVPPPDGR